MARRKRAIGERCEQGHLIVGKNVRLAGGGTVTCRECANAYMRDRYKRVKETIAAPAARLAQISAEIVKLTAEREDIERGLEAEAEASRAELTARIREIGARYPMPPGFPACRHE